jgi:hypothetical protein
MIALWTKNDLHHRRCHACYLIQLFPAGDHDARRKRSDARRSVLEQAEQLKDDDVDVSHVARVSVWEQFTRVARELYESMAK